MDDHTQVSPLVTLERVDAARDGTPVLHGVDLRLRRGEGWLITGGNGSGKSTLLALLAGRLWPLPGRGRRRYDFGQGAEHDAVSAVRRVALVGPALQHEYHRFGWNFRGRDVVLSGVQRAPVPQRRVHPAQRARVDALLEEYRLAHLADARLLALSSGEQRALLILRALATDADLLLVDEPFESLDEDRRRQLATLLATLHGAGATLAVAQPEAAPELAFLQRRLHLRDGRPATPPAPSAPAATRAALPPPRRQPLLQLRDVSVSPGDRRVLHGLDWTLHRGERWLVQGSNGAGKSTLLALLHGSLWPELGGELYWHGHRRADGLQALRRRVRLVSPQLQIRHQRPIGVLDCVLSGITGGIGVTGPVDDLMRRQARALLEELKLDSLAGARFDRLSHGQQRRVLIARALLGEPQLLLLDEAEAGLDAGARAALRDALRAAAHRGVSLVMASHDADPLPGMFTHAMRLADGRITALRALGA